MAFLKGKTADIKQIAVLTSGGDAPGMNAAIRGVVRTAVVNGLKVKGIRRGYTGLLEEDFIDMDARSTSDIIQHGGTILYTARCAEMMTEEGVQKAAEIIKKNNIDGLVVIGGDGSYRGARELAKHGVNVVGVPGTIDLDIACTDYSIGFDTALNTAMECIDRVRDTSASHERCSIIEVMGRKAGHIALWCGIANGAEEILVPERYDYEEQAIIDRIARRKKLGKKLHIIINAEGIGDSNGMAKRIEEATGLETRATIIGYIQRGGSPTCRDRVFASVMGSKAVDILVSGGENRVVCYRDGKFTDLDIFEALEMQKDLDNSLWEISRKLCR
ncbi:MAG: 6-phosphofructokinase [Lachnospiraceae bacterium]|nr:6-phosphofructokinase [Lachnospiraceae bacterium]MBO7631650.1 6-phosphofructokinase [Lachnospiraceae bacterium]